MALQRAYHGSGTAQATTGNLRARARLPDRITIRDGKDTEMTNSYTGRDRSPAIMPPYSGLRQGDPASNEAGDQRPGFWGSALMLLRKTKAPPCQFPMTVPADVLLEVKPVGAEGLEPPTSCV